MDNPEIIVANEDRVLIDGTPLIPILAQGCDGCAFDNMGIKACTAVPCCPSERGDGNAVIWIYP